MRKARWYVTRDYINKDRETLQFVEVYAEHETKEVVKNENKQWTHKRHCLHV